MCYFWQKRNISPAMMLTGHAALFINICVREQHSGRNHSLARFTIHLCR